MNMQSNHIAEIEWPKPTREEKIEQWALTNIKRREGEGIPTATLASLMRVTGYSFYCALNALQKKGKIREVYNYNLNSQVIVTKEFTQESDEQQDLTTSA